MSTSVVFPDKALPIRIAPDQDQPFSDDDFYAFCAANPNLRCERNAQGEIIIVPPAGMESSYQSGEAFGQLRTWARKDKRGRAFDSSAAFVLVTGATLSPDAAWVSMGRLAALTPEQRQRFPPVCPEFVIEVMSPSDRIGEMKAKMREWMQAGCELRWLIQPAHETVYIFRPGTGEPETHEGIDQLAADGPIAGFTLDLTDIWAGL